MIVRCANTDKQEYEMISTSVHLELFVLHTTSPLLCHSVVNMENISGWTALSGVLDETENLS